MNVQRKIALLFPLLALFETCGCGSAGTPSAGPASLVIENRSQYFLEQLRIHGEPGYRSAENRVPQGLAIGQSFLFHGSGVWFATVYREKYKGGPIVALTTSGPLDLADGKGYRLSVFDQSFRLEDAEYVKTGSSWDGAADGGGPLDAGGPDGGG